MKAEQATKIDIALEHRSDGRWYVVADSACGTRAEVGSFSDRDAAQHCADDLTAMLLQTPGAAVIPDKFN